MTHLGDRVETVFSDEKVAGQRLDVFLGHSGLCASRSRAKALVEHGSVCVNGRPSKPSYKMKKGDVIDVFLKRLPEQSLTPESIPLDILYEDENLIVVNKRPGMVVHPAQGQNHGTLVHALVGHFPQMALLGEERPGIVHRLDKGTSGVMVVAKNGWSQAELGRQFRNREVKKEYVALVYGAVSQNAGVIDTPIGRHPVNRKKMSVSPGGRRAVTRWLRLGVFQDFTLLKLVILTGRTHQIRVHLSHMKHPVVGDALYGGRVEQTRNKGAALISRPALHAWTLGFRYPRTEEWAEFRAPLPADIEAVVKRIQQAQLAVDKEEPFGYARETTNQSYFRPQRTTREFPSVFDPNW